MNIKEYKSYLNTLFAARVTPVVWGIHGVGKTAVPQQVADEGGHRLFNLRLGNMADQGDIIGLLDIQRNKDGTARSSEFIMPKWLKALCEFAEANPTKYAIIHLDEVNRVRKDMLNVVFQISLENRIHEFVLPANVRTIASANPPIDGYWVNDFTENALMDRFCHLMLNPETHEWLEYMRSTGGNADVTDFIAATPGSLHSLQTTWSPDAYCKPSNRSWEAVGRLMTVSAPRELIYGCVGSAQGMAFYSWKEQNQIAPISAQQIVDDYNKRGRKVQKSVLKLVELGRIAELSDIINQIAALAEGEPKDESEEFTLDQGANVARFLQDIPMDLAYQALGIFCLLNKMNTATFPISDKDTRDMPEQWKAFRAIEAAVLADPESYKTPEAAKPE